MFDSVPADTAEKEGQRRHIGEHHMAVHSPLVVHTWLWKKQKQVTESIVELSESVSDLEDTLVVGRMRAVVGRMRAVVGRMLAVVAAVDKPH